MEDVVVMVPVDSGAVVDGGADSAEVVGGMPELVAGADGVGVSVAGMVEVAVEGGAELLAGALLGGAVPGVSEVGGMMTEVVGISAVVVGGAPGAVVSGVVSGVEAGAEVGGAVPQFVSVTVTAIAGLTLLVREGCCRDFLPRAIILYAIASTKSASTPRAVGCQQVINCQV